MVEIIPAIIPKSFEDLNDKITLVNGLVELVQVDILDGKLTPSNSWPYNEEGEENFRKIKDEEEGFPFWKDIDFEADLMISDPLSNIQDWITAGARRLVVHFESLERPGEFLDAIREKMLSRSSMFYTEIGIGVHINTRNEEIYPLLSGVDFVQCMGIKKIGYQGEPFSEEVIPKIEDFREKFPELFISVDGGVSLENAEALISAGANRLVVGSALFNSENIEETLQEFQSLG